MVDMKELKYLREQALFYKDLKMKGYITMQVGESNVPHAEAEYHHRWMIDTIVRQDAQIESLTAQLNAAREATIEEICTKYYQPIIDNYKKVQRSGQVGRYAHQSDIELYERLIKGLRSQEWIEAALNQQEEKI